METFSFQAKKPRNQHKNIAKAWFTRLFNVQRHPDQVHPPPSKRRRTNKDNDAFETTALSAQMF
jgi:hypothetical protein